MSNLKSIALFESPFKNPYEPGRQGSDIDPTLTGFVRFTQNFPGAESLKGLETFSHIWLLYQFHHNTDWKPLVQTPRGQEKMGLYATRSPYRPNGLGLSCVKLLKIESDGILVSHFDLLDQTPILDIKPYLPYADSFPEASAGWTAEIEKEKYQISFSPLALQQLDFLKSQGVVALRNFIINQLEFEPLNDDKKRVLNSDTGDCILSYRTWRVEFQIAEKNVEVLRIYSGYSQFDLDQPQDPYQDKETHRKFNATSPF